MTETKNKLIEIEKQKLGVNDLKIVLLIGSYTLYDIYSNFLQAVKPYTRVISANEFRDLSALELIDFDVDLVVYDPAEEFSDTIFKLSQIRHDLKWAFLTQRACYRHVKMAMDFQAKAFITWGSSIHDIIDIMIQLAEGRMQEYWSAEADKYFEGNPSNRKLAGNVAHQELTPRQLEVLIHIAEGKSVKEIGKLMHLSCKSVDSHKYRLMRRLNIHDRVLLARYAIREGLLDP